MFSMIHRDDHSTVNAVYGCSSYSGQVPLTTMRPAQERMSAQRKCLKWMGNQNNAPPNLSYTEVLEPWQHSQSNRSLWRYAGMFPSMFRRWRQIFHELSTATCLRQAKREPAARSVELQLIFEALPDGLLVYDADGRIVRSNTAARQLLGLQTHPEFATLPWKERAAQYAMLDTVEKRIPPEDLALSRLLRGELLTGTHTAEDRLHTVDGHDVSFSMTGRPLFDAEGALVGAVGYCARCH